MSLILILPAIERVYPEMEPLPASWTIIGARWGNIGLAKAAMMLKEDSRPTDSDLLIAI